MERCARCDINENEIRVFDAIYEGKMASLCERCSIIENIPIIRKPNIIQLKDSEKTTLIRRTSSTNSQNNKTFFMDDELNKLEKNPERELPEENQLNLIEHYHWEIMKNRRRKGLTQKQLATALGESEIAIQMIEKNKPPENTERLITKLEQFFQMKLRKVTEMERYMMEKEKEPILLDENGQELETIPEPEPVFIELEEKSTNEINSYEESKALESLKNNYPQNEEEDLFKEKYYPIVKKPEVHCKVKIKKDSETPLLDDEAVVECRVEPQTPLKHKEYREPEEPNNENLRDFSIGAERERRSWLSAGGGTNSNLSAGGRDSTQTQPPADLNLRKTNINKITINELKDLHRRKIEATKQEMAEEQRKIEERQRIMEALRERDRIKQEEKTQQEHLEKQRIETEKQSLIQERKNELNQIRERESKDIDQFLGGSELLNREKVERIEDSESVEEFDRELI